MIHQTETKMGNTIQIIKERAASIIANGGPKTSEEFDVMKIHSSLTGGKAGNAGKRTVKKHNNNW